MAGNLDFLLNLRANTTGFNQGIDGAKFAVNALVSAMAALGVGLSVKALADTADQFATLQAKVKVAVGETGNFQEAMAGVYQVAIQTNSNLDSTASLFSQLNKIGKDMGLSQQQALDLTKTINMAVKVGGGSAESSNAAVTQLIQSLQSGVFRGDEFNSVMEQAPGIADALAKSLGVTTGELRKMAENGELTAERVIKALQEQSGAIQAQYDKFPTTISQALQRISTAWTMLIGEMDQASGASSRVAQVLVYIADNLGELKRFVDDAANGVINFTDRLDLIDSGTIDALGEALGAAYEAIKEVISAIAEIGIIGVDALNTTVDALSGVTPEANEAGESVGFLTRVFQGLSVALGFFKDGIAASKIAMNLLVGVFYDVGAVFAKIKATLTFGDLSDRFANEAALMKQAAQKAYAEANQQALDFESEGIKRAKEAVKTEEEKNQDKLNSNKQTLADIAIEEQKAIIEQAANNEKRKQLEAELGEARKSGNQSAVNAILAKLAELDKADDDFSKANIDRQSAKLKAATQYAQDAVNANNKILSAEEHQHLLAMGFLATQTDEQKKKGEVTVKALEDSSKAADGFGLSASVAAERAAKALGVDLDVAFNRVSQGFSGLKANIEKVAAGYDDLKKRGDDASNLLAMSLEELLKKARNLTEIDEVRKLYIAYGQDGKLSAQQVGDGLDAVNDKLSKQKDGLDAVSSAFKKFGLLGQEEAQKLSGEYKDAFYTLLNSGQATSEQLTEAWNKWQRSIGSAKTDAIDASLSMAASAANIEPAHDRVVKSYNRVGNAAGNAGNAGVRAAQATQEAWDNTVTSLSKWADKVDEANKKAADLSKSNQAAQSGSIVYEDAASIKSKLTALGIDDKEAERKAKIIINKALADDKAGLMSLTGPNSQWIKDLYQPNIERGLSANTIINDLIGKERSSVNSIKSTVAAPSSPYTQIDNAVNRAANNVQSQPAKTVRYDLNMGNQQVTLYGEQGSEAQTDAFLRQLETLKKGM